MITIVRALTRLLAINLPLAVLIPAAFGQTLYCAFEVTVRTPAGAPVMRVPVVLIQGHKTTLFETKTDEKGIARICDAPPEPVDIVVGFDLCGSVLIRNVEFKWPEVRRVSVAYVETFCDHMGVAPERQVLLRILDEEGQPLAGATFQGISSSNRGPDVSDSLGRVFRVVKARELLEGVVSKQGKESAHISILVADDTELKVVLRNK